jgi:hypothetical protein
MDLFKTRNDVDEYNDLLAEVRQLRSIIGDQQILLDEHGMDNRHSYEEGGSSERAAVVAWLREQRAYGTNALLSQGFANVCGILSDAIERGEHRREENK